MEQNITQAAYTLYNFTSDNVIEGRDRIPKALLKKAKGIVFLTVAKAGFVFSGRYGSGIVIAKLDSNSKRGADMSTVPGTSAVWSGPSALSLTGIGLGMQLGGEIMDLILILRSSAAVRMFMTDTQISIGGGLSVSVGPVGRAAETNIHAGSKGATAAYSCECHMDWIDVQLAALCLFAFPTQFCRCPLQRSVCRSVS
jgi:SH3 domain-containing YSC84-like protein 1